MTSMRRWVQFLVAKSLWLYGFALILPYLYYFLPLVFTPVTEQSEPIFYLVHLKTLVIDVTLVVTPVLAFISIGLQAIKSKSILRGFGLLFFAVVVTIVGLALFGPLLWADLYHEDTVWVEGKVYHLAAYPFSMSFPLLDHVFYECDSSGLWCHVAVDYIRSRWGRLTLNLSEGTIQLVEGSGEIAYTYRPEH